MNEKDRVKVYNANLASKGMPLNLFRWLNNELALIEIPTDRWDCSDSLRELGATYKQK